MGESSHDDLALVLIAVVAAETGDGRSFAAQAVNHDQRDHHLVVLAVACERYFVEMLPRLIEIDLFGTINYL